MRRAGQIFLALILVAVSLALLLVLALRTRPAHHAILQNALPPLVKLLGGAVRVGSYDGDLFHEVTLHDVQIDDAQGKPLIRVERAYARYDLRKILAGDYTFEEVRLSGGWLTFAPDDAGKLRLAGIGKSNGPPKPPSPRPIINFKRVTIDAEAMVPQRDLSGMVHIEGSLLVGEQIVVRMDRGHALISPTAGFDLSGKAIIGAKTVMESVVLDVHSDAARVLSLAGQKSSPLHGIFSAHAEGGGPLEALAMALRLTTPSGALDAKGVVDVFDGTGQLTAHGVDLEPSRFVTGSPRGALTLDLTAQRRPSGSFAGKGRIVVKQLRGQAGSNASFEADRVATSFALAGDPARLGLTLDRVELLRRQLAWRNRGPVTAELDLAKRTLRAHLSAAETTTGAEIALDTTATRQHARADLSLRFQGTSLHAQLDFPLSARADDPLHGQGQLIATVDQRLFARIRDAAPQLAPKLGWLDGSRANLRFNLGGTFAAPEASVDGELDLASPGPATGKARVTARYAKGRAEASLSTRLAHANGKPFGSLDAKAATELSVQLTGLQLRAGGLAHAPLSGSVQLSALSLDGLRTFGLLLPFRSGVVDASVELGGTLLSPTAHAQMHARNLISNNLKKLDLDLSTSFEPTETTADLQLAVEGQPMANLHARADLHHGLAHWRDAPLEAQLTLIPYPLPRIGWLAHGLEGVVHGQLDFSGSVSAPRATGKLRVDGLRMGAIHYDDIEMSLLLDGRKLSASALITNNGKTLVRANGTLPLERGAKLQVDARIDHLMVDLRSETLPGLRAFTGTLDGEAHITGAVTHPDIEARVRLSNGTLSMQASPTQFTNLALDAGLKNGQLFIDKLTLTADEGTLSATAHATLSGTKLGLFGAHVSTHRYPLSQGGLNAWLDSEVELNVARDGLLTRIQVAIRKALIELPELAPEHPLQSTGPMDDVVMVGQAAEEARPPPNIEVLITTPGAVLVRGPEAELDVRLDLRVAPAGGELGVWGRIDGRHGQLVLLGRHYDVERMHVIFDGASRPNPALEVRVTRPMTDALMMVDVTGTANAPKVTFRSDPPKYSEAQVLGEFISGDSQSVSITSRSLDHQAIGTVSSLVVGQLKGGHGPKLPIDLIKVDVGNEGYSDVAGNVESGKYLTDNLYLAYLHQFGSAPGSRPINHNEGRLDLRFLRHMLLETHFGDAAVGGIDVFWTKRF